MAQKVPSTSTLLAWGTNKCVSSTAALGSSEHQGWTGADFSLSPASPTCRGIKSWFQASCFITFRSGGPHHSQLLNTDRAYHRVSGNTRRAVLSNKGVYTGRCRVLISGFYLKVLKPISINHVSSVGKTSLEKKFTDALRRQTHGNEHPVHWQLVPAQNSPSYPPSIAPDSILMKQPLQDQHDMLVFVSLKGSSSSENEALEQRMEPGPRSGLPAASLNTASSVVCNSNRNRPETFQRTSQRSAERAEAASQRTEWITAIAVER